MYKQFVVNGWSQVNPYIIVWCKALACDVCQLRFMCYTSKLPICIVRHYERSYFFIGEYKVNWFMPKNESGWLLPLSVELLVERFIAGREVVVPKNKRNYGWVQQAKLTCPRSHIYCDVCHLDYCQGLTTVFPSENYKGEEK